MATEILKRRFKNFIKSISKYPYYLNFDLLSSNIICGTEGCGKSTIVKESVIDYLKEHLNSNIFVISPSSKQAIDRYNMYCDLENHKDLPHVKNRLCLSPSEIVRDAISSSIPEMNDFVKNNPSRLVKLGLYEITKETKTIREISEHLVTSNESFTIPTSDGMLELYPGNLVVSNLITYFSTKLSFKKIKHSILIPVYIYPESYKGHMKHYDYLDIEAVQKKHSVCTVFRGPFQEHDKYTENINYDSVDPIVIDKSDSELSEEELLNGAKLYHILLTPKCLHFRRKSIDNSRNLSTENIRNKFNTIYHFEYYNFKHKKIDPFMQYLNDQYSKLKDKPIELLRKIQSKYLDIFGNNPILILEELPIEFHQLKALSSLADSSKYNQLSNIHVSEKDDITVYSQSYNTNLSFRSEPFLKKKHKKYICNTNKPIPKQLQSIMKIINNLNERPILSNIFNLFPNITLTTSEIIPKLIFSNYGFNLQNIKNTNYNPKIKANVYLLKDQKMKPVKSTIGTTKKYIDYLKDQNFRRDKTLVIGQNLYESDYNFSTIRGLNNLWNYNYQEKKLQRNFLNIADKDIDYTNFVKFNKIVIVSNPEPPHTGFINRLLLFDSFEYALKHKTHGKVVLDHIHDIIKLYSEKKTRDELLVYTDILMGYIKSSDNISQALGRVLGNRSLQIMDKFQELNETPKVTTIFTCPKQKEYIELFDIFKYIIKSKFKKQIIFKNDKQFRSDICKNDPTEELSEYIIKERQKEWTNAENKIKILRSLLYSNSTFINQCEFIKISSNKTTLQASSDKDFDKCINLLVESLRKNKLFTAKKLHHIIAAFKYLSTIFLNNFQCTSKEEVLKEFKYKQGMDIINRSVNKFLSNWEIPLENKKTILDAIYDSDKNITNQSILEIVKTVTKNSENIDQMKEISDSISKEILNHYNWSKLHILMAILKLEVGINLPKKTSMLDTINIIDNYIHDKIHMDNIYDIIYDIITNGIIKYLKLDTMKGIIFKNEEEINYWDIRYHNVSKLKKYIPDQIAVTDYLNNQNKYEKRRLTHLFNEYHQSFNYQYSEENIMKELSRHGNSKIIQELPHNKEIVHKIQSLLRDNEIHAQNKMKLHINNTYTHLLNYNQQYISANIIKIPINSILYKSTNLNITSQIMDNFFRNHKHKFNILTETVPEVYTLNKHIIGFSNKISRVYHNLNDNEYDWFYNVLQLINKHMYKNKINMDHLDKINALSNVKINQLPNHIVKMYGHFMLGFFNPNPKFITLPNKHKRVPKLVTGELFQDIGLHYNMFESIHLQNTLFQKIFNFC